MFKIQTTWFPFGDYMAITIWPCVFYKGELSDETLNHERIHGRQQLELLIVFFYLIYLVEYLFKGYENISFEKEGYANREDLEYLKTRKFYAQWRSS